jgi:uncharacterized protein (DUF433 family)
MPTATTPHVWLDERGIAWVDETNTKVREIVLDVISHGWGPKEIHLNHPHLSLGQIHGALTYYYDNKKKIDEEIEHSLKRVEQARAEIGESPLRKRLTALGKI